MVAAASLAVCLSTLAPLASSNAFPWDNSLWQALSKTEVLGSINSNSRTQQEINKLSKDKITIMQDVRNAQPYLYYVYQQTVKRHIPAELAFLPMVESNYYPYAKSYCNAEGLWQLMIPTAKDRGIKMNWWFDGRRDFMTSTDAGLDQLERLHKIFGDWLLAIAAYNTGEGNIHKAIKYNQKHHLPTDFWSLKLSKQTMDYVPKLLAFAAILKDPGKYHLDLPKIENSSQVTLLALNKPINIAELAQIIHMDSNELLRLNPAFLRWVTPTSGTYSLVVPNNKVNEVMAALPTFTPENLWYHYAVTKTDTLKSIATQYSVSTETIVQVNNLASKQVKIGQTLLIPIDYATNTKLYAAATQVRLALPTPGKTKVADFSTHLVTQAEINSQPAEFTSLAANDRSMHPPATTAATNAQTTSLSATTSTSAAKGSKADLQAENTKQWALANTNQKVSSSEKTNVLVELYQTASAFKKFFADNA